MDKTVIIAKVKTKLRIKKGKLKLLDKLKNLVKKKDDKAIKNNKDLLDLAKDLGPKIEWVGGEPTEQEWKEMREYTDKHNKWVDGLARKYKKLNPENAIAYAKEWQDFHEFKVPDNAKTEWVGKGTEDEYIEVEVIGPSKNRGDTYPVWFDSGYGGLYGEY